MYRGAALVRWKVQGGGAESRDRRRIKNQEKHKLSNHHISALPEGLRLWNWWLNNSSHSETCSINIELKRKERREKTNLE